MLKRPNFFLQSAFYTSQESTRNVLPFSTTFDLSFMISSVAPTRSSPFYAYLITKIGNRNIKAGNAIKI